MSTLRSSLGSAQEQCARAEKVSQLVDTIDRHALRTNVHPHLHAGRIAEVVARFKREHWNELCAQARCNYPSEVTIAAILRVYLRRAECVEEERVA